MEVNARLQVEHPVTELVTGLDLVRLQLLVAMDEEVEVQAEPRGHAIECRINAEDPYRDFLPGPGTITSFRVPGGPFVRIDSGFGEGRRVPGDYDSLFAKLLVWGEDREGARLRMLRALDELHVEGIPTTVPFHRWVLQTPEFIEATAHTRWVEQALETTPLGTEEGSPEPAGRQGDGQGPRPARLVVEVDGHRVPVSIWGERLRTPPPPPASAAGSHALAVAGEVISAPMQGTILQVLVEPGRTVAAGETVCILEAMKMENHITAHQDGVVRDVNVRAGDVVDVGQVLITVADQAGEADHG